MKSIPIPMNLKRGDIIVDNHGKKHFFLSYHMKTTNPCADCRGGVFCVRDGLRWEPSNGYAVSIIRKASAPPKAKTPKKTLVKHKNVVKGWGITRKNTKTREPYLHQYPFSTRKKARQYWANVLRHHMDYRVVPIEEVSTTVISLRGAN